ncbi:MAG: UvrD-helicase domain-containing protein [Chloroflexi bacterium]|nr:UvrD-helicase domain-containing protein [Chloroflexota bacterium]
MADNGLWSNTDAQSEIIDAPLNCNIWLEGIAGSGKSSVGVARVLHLLGRGVPAESILIFVPQRALAQPYITALRRHTAHRGGQVSVQTIGSLSLQMVETFWFLIAGRAGFKHPNDLPNFLSLELVQYFMTRAIEPLVDERDYFNSVRIDRPRLYSQIVDNMNKAALVGFPISEIGTRLKSALASGVEEAHIFDDAQTCAIAFRKYCLERNMLDFSLQLEIFREHVWAEPSARRYLRGRYRHVIVDGVEEDNPASHGLLRDLLESCDSALIIYDRDAGFRRFLGADPDSARRLRDRCDLKKTFDETFVMGAEVKTLGAELAAQLDLSVPLKCDADPRPALITEAHRYHPEMVDWVARQVDMLVRERDVSPNDIVILAPFLSDALRFGLTDGLSQRGIPIRSHRPSRALRDEPAARTLLTLARLAHPHWRMAPTDFDIVFALMTAIKDLDLVRAKLLTEMLHRNGQLLPFAEVRSTAMQERVTFDLGERYDRLAAWINRYIDDNRVDAIDIFFRRLFGGLLARAGFGFHDDVDAGNTAQNLVDSARGFRWSLDFMSRYDEKIDLGLDYVKMVDRGVIANFYLRDWIADVEEGVLIAPAYTFLLNNRPVDYQFWLNIGSEGWSRRLYQPLTHPYVLSRGWSPGAVWTEDDEQHLSRETLGRLLLALTRRCRKAIYLGYSELSESGYEQRGLLLETIQSMLRRHARVEQHV